MTNFLIGYPDIPFRATTQTPSGTAATGYGPTNLVTGSRQLYSKLDTATTATQTWLYNLGSGVTASANYFAICRAKLLKGGGAVGVGLTYTGASSSVHSATVNFSSLLGPQADDYFTTFTATAAAQEWQVSISASTSNKFAHSKHYFGTLFDFGREPSYGLTSVRKALTKNSRFPAHTYKLEWEGISDTIANSFNSTILNKADINPVLLYDASNLVLHGFTVLHAIVRDAEIRPTAVNTNTITATFEELV